MKMRSRRTSRKPTLLRRNRRFVTWAHTPHPFAQRGALVARSVLMLVVLAAIYVAAPEKHRTVLYALTTGWAVVTLLAAEASRRGMLTMERITALSLLDFTLLLKVTLLVGPSLLFALPAYSLLGCLQALMWGRRGASVAALLALAAAVPVALLHQALPATEQVFFALWAAQNTTTLVLLGVYAERQKQLVGLLAEREVGLTREARRQAEMALRDPLTGLYNRRFLDTRLREEIARARRSNTALSLALIDVDYLKQWNDTLGHAAGDAAIKAVAELLQGACRQNDVVCRIGGEEFVLLAPDTEARGLHALVDRVRDTASRHPVSGDNGPLPRVLTFSAGVATLGRTQDVNGLLEAADEALYAAKEAGRNRVLIAPLRLAA